TMPLQLSGWPCSWAHLTRSRLKMWLNCITATRTCMASHRFGGRTRTSAAIRTVKWPGVTIRPAHLNLEGEPLMIELKQFEVWFVTGSQHLYGPNTLEKVAEHSREIAGALGQSAAMPVRVVFKPVMTGPDE